MKFRAKPVPDDDLRVRILEAGRQLVADGNTLSTHHLRELGVTGANVRVSRILEELLIAGDLPRESVDPQRYWGMKANACRNLKRNSQWVKQHATPARVERVALPKYTEKWMESRIRSRKMIKEYWTAWRHICKKPQEIVQDVPGTIAMEESIQPTN